MDFETTSKFIRSFFELGVAVAATWRTIGRYKSTGRTTGPGPGLVALLLRLIYKDRSQYLLRLQPPKTKTKTNPILGSRGGITAEGLAERQMGVPSLSLSLSSSPERASFV
jgi:hypothetical protein